jgi:small GTP-binding protein
MGIQDRIHDIEVELKRTQVNKATMGHICRLKSRLARLRTQVLLEEEKSRKQGAGAGDGFEVAKQGDARVIMLGAPSIGKSTFVSQVTGVDSAVAAYEFTTVDCIPGELHWRGARIQLLDLPGIIEGAAQGRGRGRQVIALARSADLVLMMLDVGKDVEAQRRFIEREVELAGIRLNRRPPQVMFQLKKAGGGITFNATCSLTHLDEKLVQAILQEYRIYNADILIREDVTVDEFIDVVEGNRVYVPCIHVYNKIDLLTIEEVDRLARADPRHGVMLSCSLRLNVDEVLERMWRSLRLVRVYTKKRGEPPDFERPLILRSTHARVVDACRKIHRSLADPTQFRYALVWGRSTKHDPQRVGLNHLLVDEDVLCVVTK